MGHETENPGMLIARHRWWGGVLVSVDLGRCVCGGGACMSSLLVTGESYTQETQHAIRAFFQNDIAN